MIRIDSPASDRAVALIVDDDPAIRMLIAESLRQKGFFIREAESGEEAIVQVASHPPDIILLDVEMPGMDGFDTCLSIRATRVGQDLPIVMVTGHDDIESINQAFEVGATDFVSKPVNWAMLGYRIRYILRSSRSFRALKESEARLADAQRVAGLGHWEWQRGEEGGLGGVSWSEQVFHILGLSPASVRPGFRAFYRRIYASDRDKVRPLIRALLQTGEPVGLEYRLQRPGGEVRVVYARAKMIHDEQGVAHRLLGTVQDITERKQAEQRIHQLAYYDPLTGLPNRQLFRDRLKQTIALDGRYGRKFAVIYADVDRFKEINDVFTHDVGDEVLTTVAKRLRSVVRQSDVVGRDVPMVHLARFGGDEFTFLLHEMNMEEGLSIVAKRILACTQKSLEVAGREFFLSLSVGIATYPKDGKDGPSLLKNAEFACHEAKRGGGNCYHYYSEQLNSRSRKRLQLENRLHKALEQNQLRVFYQPKCEVATGNTVGFEGLLRWEDPELGMVSPAEFIPVAEQSDIIVDIGLWVLEQTCRHIKAWDLLTDSRPHVALNVSGRQFYRSDFAKTLESVVEETGVAVERLTVEITESILMVDSDDNIRTLAELKELGVGLSVDDFGTGYSSLSYLTRFPIDELKIDRSFIKDLPQAKDSTQLTAAIIGMAHGLGIRVVAEGVETQAQLNFLRQHGCDLFQGFLYGRPVPEQEATLFLSDRQGREAGV